MRQALLVLLILFACAFGKLIHQKRNAVAEDIVMNIEYLGSCDDFLSDRDSIRVSAFANNTCLPIELAAGNDDADDLNADYTCTNIDRERSLIRIVEVYLTHGTPVTDFIISFVPSNPFRATTDGGVEVNYYRRPSCVREEDYCNLGNFAVTACTDNAIAQYRSHVNSRDRIYLLPNTRVAQTCVDSTGACCAYISLAPGICPYTAPTEVIVHENGEGYHHEGHNNVGGHQFPWNHYKNVQNKQVQPQQEAKKEAPVQSKKAAQQKPQKNPFQVISVFPKEEMDKDKLIMVEKDDVEEDQEKQEIEEEKRKVVPVKDTADDENEPEPPAKDLFTLGH